MKYFFKLLIILCILLISRIIFNHFVLQVGQIHYGNEVAKFQRYAKVSGHIYDIFFPYTLGEILFDRASHSENCIVKYNLNLKAYKLGNKDAVYELCKFYFNYSTYNNHIINKTLYNKGKKLFLENINNISKQEQVKLYSYLLYAENDIEPAVIKQLFNINLYESVEDKIINKVIIEVENLKFIDDATKKLLLKDWKNHLNKYRSNNAKYLLISYYFDNFRLYKKELYSLLIKLKKIGDNGELDDDLDGMLSLYYILDEENEKAKEILKHYDDSDIEQSVYLIYSYLKLKDNFLNLDVDDINDIKDLTYDVLIDYYSYLPRDIKKELLTYLAQEVTTYRLPTTKKEKEYYAKKIKKQKKFKKELQVLNFSKKDKGIRIKELQKVYDQTFSYESDRSIGDGTLKMYDKNGSMIFKSDLNEYKFTKITLKDPKKILKINPLLPLMEYYNDREVYRLLTDSSLILLYIDYPQIIEYLLEEDISNIDYREPLLKAVSINNLKTVKTLIEYGARVDDKRALYTAVKYADRDMVQFFVERGSYKNVKLKYDGKSLLHIAATRNLEIVKYLIENNIIDINIKDDKGNNALFYAASLNHLEIYDYFVSKGLKPTKEELSKAVDINIKNKNYKFLEVILLKMDESSIIKKYNNYIINNDFRDLDIKILKKFVKYNVDLGLQTRSKQGDELIKNKKMNVLELLVSELSFEELKPLLERKKKLYNELLLFAFANETQSGKKIIDYLLKKGLSLNYADVKTILLGSIKSANYINISFNISTITGRLNHTPMFGKKTWRRDINLLQKITPNLSKSDIFEIALETLNYAFLKYAITKDIDINKMYKGSTALCTVSKNKVLYSWDTLDLIELLVDNGARLENIDKDGNSIFFTIIESGSGNAFQRLLELYDININYQNNKKQNIFEYFSQKDKYNIENSTSKKFIKILNKHLKKKNLQVKLNKEQMMAIDFDNDLFHLVKEYKKLDTKFTSAFQKQIDNGIKINSRNIDGDTILHYAVKYGDKELVTWIIKTYKLDIDVENYHNKSVRQYLANNFLNLIINYKGLNDEFKNEFIYYGKNLATLDDKLHKSIQKYGDNELFSWLKTRYNIKSFKYKHNKIINTLWVELEKNKIDKIKYKDEFSWARIPYDLENAQKKQCNKFSYKLTNKDNKLTLKVTNKKTQKSTLFKEDKMGYGMYFDFKHNMLCTGNIITTYAGFKIYAYDLQKGNKKQFVYRNTVRTIDTFAINDTPYFLLSKDQLIYIDKNLRMNTLSIDTKDLFLSYDGKYLRTKAGKKFKYFKSLNGKNIINKEFEEFRDAILHHDKKRVKKMLKTGIDPNISLHAITPLLMATIVRDIKIVALLSKWQANILYHSTRFGSPLGIALESSNFELIKALQPNNKNKKTNFIILSKLNSKDKDYSKIINYYFSKNRLSQEKKDELLKKKIYYNDLVMIDFLLTNGAKLDNSRYINDNFVNAMRTNNQELIKQMLKFKNLNINYKYNYSHTFLRIATECNLEIVKLLVENGATIDATLLKTVKDTKILDYLKSKYMQKGTKDE